MADIAEGTQRMTKLSLGGLAQTVAGLLLVAMCSVIWGKVSSLEKDQSSLNSRVTVVETTSAAAKEQMGEVKADLRRIEDKVDRVLQELKK